MAAEDATAQAAVLNPVWTALVAHVDAIARIAAESEPDWALVNPDVDLHNWCGDACGPVRDLLAARGIRARVVKGELRGWTHAWLVLDDGSILDPTISQFDRPGSEYSVDTDVEVHWLRGAAGTRIALIAPSMALHRDYRPMPPRR